MAEKRLEGKNVTWLNMIENLVTKYQVVTYEIRLLDLIV